LQFFFVTILIINKTNKELHMKNPLFLLALTLALTLTSCSWLGLGGDDSEDGKVDVEEVKRPVEEVYAEGRELLARGSYTKAIGLFQEVERLYPFSPLANKSKVMEAYAQYKDEEYEKAIALIDDFVQLNPGTEDIEFMYYMKAMCYYNRISDVKRDQGVTVKAQAAFAELTNRFPKGKYARDGEYKLDLIKDHLAAKEMEVGRYYQKQNNQLAAINRYKSVVKEYDDTQQIEEALYRLTEANTLLGLDQEALKYSTILGYNYPSSKWYKRSYRLMKGIKAEGKKTFVGRALESFGLGREPETSTPDEIQSVPNLVDTGGWISDDSAIVAEESIAPKEKNPESDNVEVKPVGITTPQEKAPE
jgi:outer membrane protein assembly factor BamD